MVAKAWIAIALCCAMILIHKLLRDDARALHWSPFIRIYWLWILTRLAPWLLIYVILGIDPQSDVATAYWPLARGVLMGQVPYLDVECFFSPLFSYLLAIPAVVWFDPRSLIIFITILEAAAVAVTLRCDKIVSGSPQYARWLCGYYVAPGPFLLAIIGGQEDFLLWFAAIPIWLMLVRNREFAAGISALLGGMLTKPLFVVAIFSFYPVARRKIYYILGFVPLAGLALIVLWSLTGSTFLQTLRQASNVSPPNIWIWIHMISSGYSPLFWPGFSTLMLSATCLFGVYLFQQYRLKILSNFHYFAAGWTLLFVILMLINLKSLGAYIGYFALPSWAVFQRAYDQRGIIPWTVLGAIAPVECSLWHRLNGPILSDLPDQPLVWIEYGCQGLMLICLVAIANSAWKNLQFAAQPS